ncbi:MAG: hypothetical protein NZV14_17470 [Bryobacteraceae bacterium]|nr:hypothetical protein [Bryobacteraceae bacterium]MDW8379952.1 hypothetical protein [Bryobacterales bacterium]
MLVFSGKIQLKPLTPGELATLRQPGPAPTVGVHRNLPEQAHRKGRWKRLSDGNYQWRLEIRSPGARSLRVRFTDFDTGRATVRVCEQDGKRCYGPYTGKGPHEDHSFWSDTVEGDTVRLEFVSPVRRSPLPFRIPEIAHHR